MSFIDLTEDIIEPGAPPPSKIQRILSLSMITLSKNIQQPQSNIVPIVLKPNQPVNVENITNILTVNKFAVDNSMAGAGKTIMSLASAQRLGFKHVVVICPTSTISEWKRQLDIRGFSTSIQLNINDIPVVLDHLVIGYESLRSTCEGIGKHKLFNVQYEVKMVKRKGGEMEEKRTIVFQPSHYLKELVQSKCLFIFDEFHRMKNKTSLQHDACSAITKYVCSQQEECGSRCLFLSATPFDKAEQIVGFLYSVNITSSQYLIGPPKGINPAIHGLGELVSICYRYNPDETVKLATPRYPPLILRGKKKKEEEPNNPLDKIKSLLPRHYGDAVGLVHKLYTTMMVKIFSSAAPSFSLPFDLNIADGYYNLTLENAKLLHTSLFDLQSAIVKQRDGIADFSAVTNCLVQIESHKTEIFIRLIHQQLQRDPQCKVICMLNYHSNMENISKGLTCLGVEHSYIPLGTSARKREEYIKSFQEHNLNHRVLIGNISVLGTGINLDDQSPGGNFPRRCFISPSYFYMTLHQAAYRCYRANTTSQPTVRYVYGKVDEINIKEKINLTESRILDNMATKTHIMSSVLTHQIEVQDNVKFPGKHNTEKELDEYLDGELYSGCWTR